MNYNIKKTSNKNVNSHFILLTDIFWVVFFYILTGKFSDVISPTFKTASHQFSSSEILE